jgi:hypothetical protein
MTCNSFYQGTLAWIAAQPGFSLPARDVRRRRSSSCPGESVLGRVRKNPRPSRQYHRVALRHTAEEVHDMPPANLDRQYCAVLQTKEILRAISTGNPDRISNKNCFSSSEFRFVSRLPRSRDLS